MALFRAVGRELLRQQKESEARLKRQKQLEYMRELDRQVQQKMQRSKSRSGQKKMSQSAVSQFEKGSSGQKMTKSLLLQQLLSMDYESFKKERSQKSRSRSKRKYHMLQQVGNQQEYRQIKECKTIFVDKDGKNMHNDEMRDDKNYVRQELSPEQSLITSEIASIGEQNKEESEEYKEESQEKSREKSEKSPPSQAQPIRQPLLIKPSDLPTISNLAIFHSLNNPLNSDRLTNIINENSHRFPKILQFTKNKQIKQQLDQLDKLIKLSISKPKKPAKPTNPPDQLHQIKDILSEIQSISQPTRVNKLMGKQIQQHLKLTERVSFIKTLKKSTRNDKRQLDQLIETYTTA